MNDLTVDISRVCGAWQSALPDVEEVVRRAVGLAWKTERANDPVDGAEVSVALVDDMMMRRLNRTYRGKDLSTNVLAFPAADNGAAGRVRLLGDILLAYETVRRESAEQSKSLASHTSHLVVHGMLHLMGQVHDTEVAAAAMEAKEIEILAGLGVANPYAAVEDPSGGA